MGISSIIYSKMWSKREKQAQIAFLTKAGIKINELKWRFPVLFLVKCAQSGKMEFMPFYQRPEWNKLIEMWISSVIFSKMCSESGKNLIYVILFKAGIKYMNWNGDLQLYF